MEIISNPKEIEKKSMSIIEECLPELRNYPYGEREVVKRVIHATGDPECISLIKISQSAIESGLQAIRSGCSILTDVNMLKSGLITERMSRYGVKAHCLINDPEVLDRSRDTGRTRAMLAIQKGADMAENGIVAVGNAPTALFMLCQMIRDSKVRPALVVGTPVGFVGAADSKEMLMKMGVPYMTMIGTKGGSTVAASMVNALLIMA